MITASFNFTCQFEPHVPIPGNPHAPFQSRYTPERALILSATLAQAVRRFIEDQGITVKDYMLVESHEQEPQQEES